MTICEHCGKEYDPAGDSQNQCPFCGQIPGMSAVPTGADNYGSEDGAARGECSWERRKSWLDLQAMFEMIRIILLDPVSTFKRMKLSGDLNSPLLFVLILGTVGAIAGLFWSIFVQGFPLMPARHGAGRFALSIGMKVAMAIFSPLLVLIGTFISAGIMHVCLMIVGGQKHGFEATFRVMAYAAGATALFQLVPFCGGIISGIWAIVIQVIGAREMHETTTGKALTAVLLPIICCCGCILLIFFLGAGAYFMRTSLR
jgi:hypothetical protein